MASLEEAEGVARLLAWSPLAIADFEKADAAIKVALESQRAAEAQPASDEPSGPLHVCEYSRARRAEQRIGFNRSSVDFALRFRDALQHSNALAELENKLFRLRDEEPAAPRERLEEAIDSWKLGLRGTWARDKAPRKWAALTHNIGLSELTLGQLNASEERIRAGLSTIEDAAAALDPEQDLWNHSAIWFTSLRFSHS